ncbi:MAG: helix-turn-helix transcriptional regulator [Actinobacteria bacterium]|nr:helix-turn-helix transcriptional regulator [Actinomycetota bacterium]
MTSSSASRGRWTFLSNHGHALVFLAKHDDPRVRDVAEGVGITERAAQSILSDLAEAGYVTVTRVGRRNHYALNPELPLRHPHEADHTVGELLAVFGDASDG